MAYEIGMVSPNDADALYSLINRIKDEEKYLFFTLRFPPDGTKKYVESHIAAGNPMIGAYAEDGKLVGWIDFKHRRLRGNQAYRHDRHGRGEGASRQRLGRANF